MSLQHKIDEAIALLRRIEAEHAPAALATSFGAEDQVLTDLIARHARGIGLFSLDTGRLPEETHRVARETADRYNVRIQVYYPRTDAVEVLVNRHGPNAFYDSVELRKACCDVRKVEPLRRALAGKKAWVTGLRREQAPTRRDLSAVEHDAVHGIAKFNPLIDWTVEDVWAYIRAYEIPYNALHDRNYPSIGCAPCTRAVQPGEDIRAGRWWWESPESKECGLHKGPVPARVSASAA